MEGEGGRGRDSNGELIDSQGEKSFGKTVHGEVVSSMVLLGDREGEGSDVVEGEVRSELRLRGLKKAREVKMVFSFVLFERRFQIVEISAHQARAKELPHLLVSVNGDDSVEERSGELEEGEVDERGHCERLSVAGSEDMMVKLERKGREGLGY